MSPIKDFTLTYEALNKENTFSEGDTVTGTVTFTLSKDTEVKSVLVKVKGDANVHWTEGTGDRRRRYSAHRRYCKVKQYLVEENSKGTELSKGDHRYKFSLKIPQEDMPSSFKALHGKIVYVLQAKISRSWRIPSVEQKELKFMSKSLLRHGQVMGPSFGSVGKQVGTFSKGEVQMSATLDRKVCFPVADQSRSGETITTTLSVTSEENGRHVNVVNCQIISDVYSFVHFFITKSHESCSGDTLSVTAKIHNSSSKTMKPKFGVHQNIVYRAVGSRKYGHQTVCKLVGEPIAPNSEETVSCQVTVPFDTSYTIKNCEILSVEYCLKVYLDIKFSFDPEVVFPLVILPPCFATLHPGQAVGPHPGGAVGAPSYSDFPPPAFPPGTGPAPAFPTGPYPVPPGPGAQPAPAVPFGPYPGPPGPGAGPAPAFPTGPYPGPPGPGAEPAPAFPTGPYPGPPGPGARPAPAPAIPSGPYPLPPGSGAVPPPVFPFGPFPVPTGPGAYGYPAPGPTQQANTTSGHNNPWPQQAPPFGYPTGAFPPSSVQPQTPSAPPLSQQGGGPPAYMSLYPPSQDTVGNSGADKKN